MKKKIFIFSDYKKSKDNFVLENISNKKYLIYFNSINFKKIKYYKNRIKKNDLLFFFINDEKYKNTSSKILFLSSILELVKVLKIKNKIIILNIIIKNKYQNNQLLYKLEKKIFSEIIESYNSMFSLNFSFYNKMDNKKKIDFINLIKNQKIKK